ncbi:MAG: DNA mismatch repair endonuclease MutL [bacterium]
MYQKIKVLPEKLANMIAAGEVVERPASVVKELVENSIDADADRIEINCRGSGKKLIQVLDNGQGMEYEDALICLERHATSKIQCEDDLTSIHTLGFRGEALPSIASVSEMVLTTRTGSMDFATRIILKAGVIKQVTKSGSPIGTMVEVKNLFSNVPVRAKFLRSPQTELSHIIQTVLRQAVPRHDISFLLSNDGDNMLHLVKSNNLGQRLFQILGQESIDDMIEIEDEKDGVKIKGFISKINLTRSNLLGQYLYINSRFIKSPIIQKAIHNAYHPYIPRQRYPLFCLLIDIDPKRVDFNVHPTKLEVRFDNPARIVDLINTLIKENISLPMIWPKKSTQFQKTDITESNITSPNKTDLSLYNRHSKTNFRDFKPMQVPLIMESGKSEYPAKQTIEKPDDIGSFYVDNDKDKKRQELIPLGPCIQINHSYIVYEAQECIVIIDQHAAHERINYEKIRSLLLAEKPPRQNLLTHPIITVSPEEDAFMDQVIPLLNELGFILEPFGTRTYILRCVPPFFETDPTQIMQTIIHKLLESRSINEKAQIIEPLSATMACHLSVKAHQYLKPEEIHQLINDLLATEHPYSCPHGRPTLFKITQKDIEKNFGR